MGPAARHKHFELHGVTPLPVGGPLGEPHQVPSYAGAAPTRDDGQHAELADAVAEELDSDAPDDLPGRAGDGELAGPHHVCDPFDGRTGRAVYPQAFFRRRVDAVDQVGKLGRQRGVISGGGWQHRDLNRPCCRHRPTLDCGQIVASDRTWPPIPWWPCSRPLLSISTPVTSRLGFTSTATSLGSLRPSALRVRESPSTSNCA